MNKKTYENYFKSYPGNEAYTTHISIHIARFAVPCGKWKLIMFFHAEFLALKIQPARIF